MSLEEDTPADYSEEDKMDEECVSLELGLWDARSHDGWGPCPLDQSIPETGMLE